MLILRFIISFQVTPRTGLHAFVLKKKTHQFSHTVQSCSTVFPLLDETLCFSSRLFKARLLNTRSSLIART